MRFSAIQETQEGLENETTAATFAVHTRQPVYRASNDCKQRQLRQQLHVSCCTK